jgi:hypothetical protein
MNNGSAERKSANHRPELARENTIQKARACIYAALPHPVMGALVSGGRQVLGRKLWAVSPTLNVVQAASTNYASKDGNSDGRKA